MKKNVRGGALLSLLCLFVAIIYVQAMTGSTLAIANDSQLKIEDSIDSNLIGNFTDDDEKDKKDEKKLVKTTAIVKASSAGASRGSFSASAYCFSGRTASGQGVRRGIIAADHRVLKM